MLTSLKITQKALLLVLIPLIFEIGFVLTMGAMLQQSEAEVQRELWAKKLMASYMAINYCVQDAMKSVMIMVSGGGDDYVSEYRKALLPLNDAFAKAKKIASTDPQVLRQVEDIERATLDFAKGMDTVVVARQNGSAREALYKFQGLRSTLKEMTTQVYGLREYVMKLQEDSPDVQSHQRERLKMVLVGGLVFNIILAILLTIMFNKDIVRRLNVLMDNALRLVSGQELNPELEGVDELARLDTVVHDVAIALNEAHKRERSVIQNAQDVIFSIDQEGLLQAVNPAAYKVWGYSPEELMGKNILHLVIEKDRDNTREFFSDVQAGTAPSVFENQFLRKDGKQIFLLWSAFWSANDELIFCVVHDVSERKEYEMRLVVSEARVRSIIEGMPLGILSLDTSGRIESVNPRTEHLFGFDFDELNGKELSILFVDQAMKTEQGLKDWLQVAAQGQQLETKMQRKDASEFPADVSLTVLNSLEGEKLLITVQDASTRYEVQRIKQEFYAMVTHDLRTPLQSVGGSLTLMSAGAAGELPKPAAEMISMAERNCRRLNELINDLLDLEKLESGKFDMLFDDTDLLTVFISAKEAVESLAKSCSVTIRLPQETAVVHADDDRLVQVMINLLSNAIKYSPEGSVVDVTMEREPSLVRIAVNDRGSGIPKQYQGALFERFKQVGTREARKQGSTGLGLAICKLMIEQHGGQIGVDSEEGKGSSFWFTLPI